MILLGIDPGSVKTGYGVLSVKSNKVSVVDFGVIRPNTKAPFEVRLLRIHEGLCKVLEAHPADIAVVERTFQGVRGINIGSILKLAQARGVALMAAAGAGVEVVEVAPAVVKKAVTGSGRALKSQVQLMVKALLKIPGRIPEDAADALALALTQTHRRRAPVADGRLR